MENTFIPKAMELVKEAIQADNASEWESALSLYKQGLNYFMTGMKYTKNEKSKAAIREKMAQYMKRAEDIKSAMDNKSVVKPKKQVINDGGQVTEKKERKEADDGEKDTETAKLQSALASAIVSEKPNVKWDDVAGLEGAKAVLKEAVIMPIKFPQLFTGKLKPWQGILLYGPPGTGKSFLAKAVATECGASCFLAVSSADLVSKFQGESERLVKNLFELARRNQPSIIFIDEIDSLCSSRSDGDNDSARRIKTEFLVQMQGVGKGNKGVLVLGATNTPWELDQAIRRRFEKRVYISLPDMQARATMFKLHIGNTPNSLDANNLSELGRCTDGYSGSDISVVVRDALYEPVRTCQLATHFKQVWGLREGLARPCDAICASQGRASPEAALGLIFFVQVPDPSGKQTFLWEPCSPSAPDAKEMTLADMPGELLKPIELNMRHFQTVIRQSKPTVSPGDLIKQEEWTLKFGQEGSL
jgi:vacuolar protein-sorting-associated protein 4